MKHFKKDYQNLTIKELAEKYKVCSVTIHRYAKALGLSKKRGRRFKLNINNIKKEVLND